MNHHKIFMKSPWNYPSIAKDRGRSLSISVRGIQAIHLWNGLLDSVGWNATFGALQQQILCIHKPGMIFAIDSWDSWAFLHAKTPEGPRLPRFQASSICVLVGFVWRYSQTIQWCIISLPIHIISWVAPAALDDWAGAFRWLGRPCGVKAHLLKNCLV